MNRVDHSSNLPAASNSKPAVEATVAPGYFRRPSAALGIQGTVVTADWANDIQEELAYLITQNGGTLAKGTTTQVHTAIESQIDGNVSAHAGLVSSTSALGHLIVASAAEAANLTNNARAITPGNLSSVFEIGSNANGNYFYLPTAAPTSNRYVIQWGSETTTQNGTLTLPVTMANTDYFSALFVETALYPGPFRIHSQTTTTFAYSSSNAPSATSRFFVFGLGA